MLALQCSYQSWHALSRLMWSVLALATSMAIMALLSRYWRNPVCNKHISQSAHSTTLEQIAPPSILHCYTATQTLKQSLATITIHLINHQPLGWSVVIFSFHWNKYLKPLSIKLFFQISYSENCLNWITSKRNSVWFIVNVSLDILTSPGLRYYT